MTGDKKDDTIHPLAVGLPTDEQEIEQRSHQIIDHRLAAMDLDPAMLPIARRVIHATADFSFGESLRVHPRAMDRAVAAIAACKPIVCDVRMVHAGITKTGCEVLCAISDPEVVRQAKAQGCTRSAAAMEFLAERIDGAIVHIAEDILSDDADSWKSVVGAKETTCAKPLGYNDKVLAVYFGHLDEALATLKKGTIEDASQNTEPPKTQSRPKRKSSAYTSWKRRLPFWPRKAYLLAEQSVFITLGVLFAQVLEVSGAVKFFAILILQRRVDIA